MTEPLHATEILRAGTWKGAGDLVVLRHDERMPKRNWFETVSGQRFDADLKARELAVGDAFRLNDGQLVEVVAAEQDLLAITGDLPRLLWHIGRCHARCQIEADRVLVVPDATIESLMRSLGAAVEPVREPFVPECEAEGVALPEMPGAGGKRHVHLHVSHVPDAEDELPDVPASNA
jgi:urease accessory protein